MVPHFYIFDAYTDGKLDYALIPNKDSITLKRNGNSYDKCIITIKIMNGAGQHYNFNDTIFLGSSDLANVWGYWQDPVCMCAWDQYDIRTTYHPPDISFNWQFMYGSIQIIEPYHIRVTPYMDGGYVTLVATTSCGADTTINVNYPACGYCPNYYMVYPNPSNLSDIIYIETTEEALEMMAKAKDIMGNLSTSEAANIKLPNLDDYNYRILSRLGEVKMNGKALGGKVILNVYQLKPGIYYVVIDSGIKPETHELIIN